MRMRRRASPFLLLLLPTLAAALSTDNAAAPAAAAAADADVQRTVRDAAAAVEPDPIAPASSLPTNKLDLGTKDAPVDGLDGKPHKGPWVESAETRAKKKPAAAVEDILAAPAPSSSPLGGGPQADASSDGGWQLMEPDGVMDDLSHPAPKEGTTGTEGGISEKDRARKAHEEQTGSKLETAPDPPKEAPPLPHVDQEQAVDDADRPKGAPGLETPEDLPDKPHDIPHPYPASSEYDPLAKEPPADIQPGVTTGDGTPLEDEDPSGVIQPFHSFILSLAMIIFSEIGDKTFLVAALMAMRHPRLLVFSAAFAALITMTVLSAVLGHAVPTLLPKRFTSFMAAILFLIFGAKMLREGLAMSPDEGVGEEMKEVEMELEEKEHTMARRNSRRRSSISPYVLEAGRAPHARRSRSNTRLPAPPRSPSSSPSRSPSPRRNRLAGLLTGLNNLFSLLLSPAWVQTFVMTFLGEWGDRSQIATIAMAAGQDYWWVTSGAIVGHAMCTGGAVIGGRAIAGRVSMRVVTLGGAVAFIIFGLIYLVEGSYTE
ncbi:hypothetical protein BDY21DRAFT_385515 [Lineolata rhizophorae]|uniref:Uncharacterized protein n=1 Tax=Lineolata rhizophorae TaxID=578093 RepID=A0A6A6P1C6_9PEZI|nr:hypothetical protein BDY21DRAFT_385515 [Lineolata rhizophorae]